VHPPGDSGATGSYPQQRDGWYELFRAGDGSQPLEIAPGRQGVFHFLLSIPASTPVLSGKYTMVLDAQLRYQKDGYSNQAELVSFQEFQAGVLGETEFVGSTAIPFLLLPGFLFVTAVSLLFGKVWPKWNISLDYKKPEFYLVGTLISMVWLFAYPPLSPWIYRVFWKIKVEPRDYLSGYSIADIVNVWALAVGSALLLWVVPGGIVALLAKARAHYRKDRTPTMQDRPLALLRRLALARQDFELPQVTVGGATLWEIPLPSPDPAKKWVAGRVEIRFLDVAPEEKTRFYALMADSSSTAEMHEYLRELSNRVELEWNPKGDGPKLVAHGEAPRAQHAADPFLHERI
jgi:hypothetical protein